MSGQTIIWGLDTLGTVLRSLGVRRTLLVADASFPFLSVGETLLREVAPAGRFSAFHANPVYEEVLEGVRLFRDGGFDSLVAVGGGSAMDVAKCIKLEEIGRDASACGIPLLAIPTTAGTGAESTGNAVYYLDGVKQTLSHPGIRPDYVFLEPSVLETLPLYQKKCTMMDALCQGIESWWSRCATEESRGYSRQAVEGVMRHWRSYIFDFQTDAAREILLAANYGGRAIHIAHTTSAHAMSYKLGSVFGLPHGHAVAVCLPEIWDYMLLHADTSVLSVFSDIAAAMDAATPAGAVGLFRGMMAEMGLENPQAGRDREALLEELASSVNQTRLRNNPVPLDGDTCRQLYDKIIR